MKTTFKITLTFLLFNLFNPSISKCQIVWEHDYPSNSGGQVKFVNFQSNGEKFVRLSYPHELSQFIFYSGTREITIYNLNHSLFKTIPLTGINFSPDTVWAGYAVMYVSDNLFNTDPLIEFMFTVLHHVMIGSNQNLTFSTYVYNENLNLVFSDTIAGPWYGFLEFPWTYLPVVNTSVGTKMIINTGYPDFKARVYGLPGQLATSADEQAVNVNGQNEDGNVNIFPNPSHDFTTVEYDLPVNIEKADLVFYDLNGKKIKSFTVDHAFHNLQLTTKDLSAGSYYCQMESDSRIIKGKKFVVIH